MVFALAVPVEAAQPGGGGDGGGGIAGTWVATDGCLDEDKDSNCEVLIDGTTVSIDIDDDGVVDAVFSLVSGARLSMTNGANDVFIGFNIDNLLLGSSSGWVEFEDEDTSVTSMRLMHTQGFAQFSSGAADLAQFYYDGSVNQVFKTVYKDATDEWCLQRNDTTFKDGFCFDRISGNIVVGDLTEGTITMNRPLKIGASGTSLSASIRATATIDYASIAAQVCIDNTITVTGAAVGSETSYSLPAAPTTGLTATSWISAADTCTIRLCNVTVGAIDPASATYGCRTWEP
jgi:hypothetical protein